MNDVAATSEWSTGCESGWTVYLDESYLPTSDNIIHHPAQSYRIKSARNDDNDNDNDDDEDLSMVSDASSGPPHFFVQGDDNEQSYSHSASKNCYYSTTSEKSSKKSDKRSKKSSKEHKKMSASKHQQYHLDDTASSPAMTTYSKMYDNASNMGLSQNFSAAHFEGNSSYNNNHYSFWQSSHVNDTNYSNEPGEFSGRGWE